MEKIEKFQILISCLLITLGVLISSIVFASKISNDNITVTGSASKIVKSDSAKLGFDISSRAQTQKEAFAILKKQTPEVEKFLLSKGIQKQDIDIKTMHGYYNYKTNAQGYSTNEVSSYSANLNFEVKSKDVDLVKKLSTEIQELTNNGIQISIFNPEYFYSDLASIKIDLLNEASKDARQRAQSMLSATNAKVGKVKSMRMGVFQITPIDSNSVSNMGLNDTTTIDKKVTAVANVVFNVK